MINNNILQILRSDLRRVVEQDKFTYSPIGKALEKQTKTIEDQDKEQTKALEEHGKQLIKSSDEKYSLELLKQKEIFDELVSERRFDKNKSSERIDVNNLTYYYQVKGVPKYFISFKGPLIMYNNAKNDQIRLQEEEKFKKNLNYSQMKD